MAALQSVRLFPWFFVIPGLLIAEFAVAALVRPSPWRAIRWVLVILGVRLIAAPGIFQMFQVEFVGGAHSASAEMPEVSLGMAVLAVGGSQVIEEDASLFAAPYSAGSAQMLQVSERLGLGHGSP